MKPEVQIALITAITSIVLQIGNGILGIMRGRKAETVAKNVEKIEVATNSMKDALVKSTAEASHAIGHLEGVKDEQARMAPAGELPPPGVPLDDLRVKRG